MNNRPFLCFLTVLFCFCMISLSFAEVFISGEDFEMGSYYCEEEQNNSDWCNDETLHKVHVDSFYIDEYEVTNG